jgi:hypothetical protein
MLQGDPAERITIPEIFNHVWVRTTSSIHFVDIFHQFTLAKLANETAIANANATANAASSTTAIRTTTNGSSSSSSLLEISIAQQQQQQQQQQHSPLISSPTILSGKHSPGTFPPVNNKTNNNNSNNNIGDVKLTQSPTQTSKVSIDYD